MSDAKFIIEHIGGALLRSAADRATEIVAESARGTRIYQYVGAVDVRTVPHGLKVGDVVADGAGRSVRIICVDAESPGGNSDDTVIGLLRTDTGIDRIRTYRADGLWDTCGEESNENLVMPEGTETRKVLVPPEGDDDE